MQIRPINKVIARFGKRVLMASVMTLAVLSGVVTGKGAKKKEKKEKKS